MRKIDSTPAAAAKTVSEVVCRSLAENMFDCWRKVYTDLYVTTLRSVRRKSPTGTARDTRDNHANSALSACAARS